MRRVLRWLRNALLGLVALIVVAAIAIYALSERVVRRTYDTPGRPIVVPADSASVREGHRLARIRGCTGCHGSQLEGEVFIDNPLLARLVSPNLTIAVREYTDAELERIIRHGVRPDGRSVIAMPSAMFNQLDDADLGMILAYVRSVPEVPGLTRDVRLRAGGRLGVVAGVFVPAAAQARQAEALSSIYPRAGEPTARGAYLARTVCTECHGLDLRGRDKAPDLRIAAGYAPEQFLRLMRTGKALGDRELPLMSQVARGRFSHFTDAEIEALYGYLRARAAMPDSGGASRD